MQRPHQLLDAPPDRLQHPSAQTALFTRVERIRKIGLTEKRRTISIKECKGIEWYAAIEVKMIGYTALRLIGRSISGCPVGCHQATTYGINCL